MIYKFIDIPGYELISDKIYDYIVSKTDVIKSPAEFGSWNRVNTNEMLELIPEIQTVLHNFDLEAERITIIKINPHVNLPIHIDSDRHPRMLWPVRNCQGSYTKFFNVDKNNIVTKVGAKGDVYNLILNPESAVQIDQLELTQPVIFDPTIPHGVWTNPEFDGYRLTMTIKFKTIVELS